MKKIFRLCFSIILFAAVLTFSSQAADILYSGTCGADGDNLTWTLDSEGTLAIEGSGAMKDYSSSSYIPWYSNRSSIKTVSVGEGVTRIGYYAFYDCSSLTSVTIPDGVTSIGGYAFYGCSSLTSVTIPESVKSIGRSAFYGCSSLTSVTIPSSVTSIGDTAFSHCSSLTSVTIPEGVTRIGNSAFSSCSSLTSVTIPARVTSIGDRAFYNCSRLTSVAIPEGVTSIGDTAFSHCSSLTSVTIPEGVTRIGNSAFYSCSSLTSVTIPARVTSIGDYAFEECSSLTSVTIQSSVTSIGKHAFYNCRSLKSVYIIDLSAWCDINFSNYYSNPLCNGADLYIGEEKATDIEIPNGVTSIGEFTFSGCSGLMSVSIPDGVKSIGEFAFSGCSSLKSVYINDLAAWCNIKFSNASSNPLCNGADLYIGEEKATDIEIPERVTSIGAYAFFNCSSLTLVTIPSNVTSVGIFSFSYCSNLISVNISDGVASICDSAFIYCSNLTSVMIPETVTSIGVGAFEECRSLKSVYITDLAAWCNIKFSNASSNPLCNSADLYIGGEKATDIEIPEGVTSIGYCAFVDCSSLTSVTISSSVTSIGNSAFQYCKNLTLVSVPEGVTNIDGQAFYNCDSLKSVTIPSSVTSIGYDAFAVCRSLTSVTISEGVTNIENYAFFDCDRLTSVTIPTSLTSIGDSAFNVCSSLNSIYYGGVKSQFVRINIGTNNAPFNSATVYYQGVPVTGVTLNTNSLSLVQDESAQLKATVLPENASDKTVTWSVSNSNVASVSEGGVVTALKAGTAEITVTTADGGYTDVCTVTVTAPPTMLNRDIVLVLDDSGSMGGTPIVELKKAAIKFCNNILDANGTNRIAIVIFSSSATSYDFSSDKKALSNTINSMTARGDSTNIAKALASANSLFSKSAEDTVKSVVLMTDGAPVGCTNNEVVAAANTVKGKAALFTLGFFHSLSGSSKDTASKLLKDIQKAGYYEVTYGSKLDDSFFEISEIITKIPVTGISLDKEQLVLTEGESTMLNVSLEPHDTTERTVYWSSSNEAVATVSSSGVVTAVGEGKVTVTARASSGDFKAECTVIVNSSEAWYYTYTVKSDGTAEITGYRTGLQGDIVIPSYVNEYQVTSIGSSAFSGCSSLTSVTIPEGVTSIGDCAFFSCSLTSVTIPSSVAKIGIMTFIDCSYSTSVYITDLAAWCKIEFQRTDSNPLCNGADLYVNGEKATDIEIPSSVTSIGGYAFYNCSSLTSVTIPDGVTRIGYEAFSGCSSLTSVTIPSSVTSIGYEAFAYCSKLTEIIVNENNQYYSSDERGVLFNKDKTQLIQYPIGNTAASYAIPSGVTNVGSSAFAWCSSLTSVTIPEGVTSIGNRAFYNCSSLTSVTIPSGVTSIGYEAFAWCSSLTSVTIPEGVTSIGGYAFSGCSSLKSVFITDLAAWCKIKFSYSESTPLCNGADLYINGEKATDIVIPSGVTSIGSYAFYGCSSLTSVTIPSSVTSIGGDAFRGCSSLKDVYYTGTEEEWSAITIGSSNTPLTNATIHYNTVPAAFLTLDKDIATLAVGDTLTLTATVSPTEGTNPTVTWTSSNPDIATVEGGVVTAKAIGAVTITATAEFGGCTAACEVTVILLSDVTGDGNIDVTDLRAYFATVCGAESVEASVCDIDGDGTVGLKDLRILAHMLDDSWEM